MIRRTWLGAWLAVLGALLLATGVRAQEPPWYVSAEGIEAGLFGSLHEGDPEAFRALLVTGTASPDATAALDSFAKVREWLASKKVDLSKAKLLKSGPNGIALLSFRPGRSVHMVWDLKHRDVRFLLGCAVTFLEDGRPATARVAGPLRCWTPAQGVRVTAGKGESLGAHEVRRYVVEGQAAGELELVLRRSDGENGTRLPVPRGSWKLALSVVECPGKGSFMEPAPSYDLVVADKHSTSSTRLDVAVPAHSEVELSLAFTDGVAGPLDLLPLARRSYFRVPEGAEASPANLVQTLEVGVRFHPE